ncbi:1-phosphofructokinase family hexose kinase [Arthrobacter sp. RT-1]|nr:1-phosphofructokinase family hexose kinase [Arthrobacter sp. RT-1]
MPLPGHIVGGSFGTTRAEPDSGSGAAGSRSSGPHVQAYPRVVTLTPAPSIDRVYFLERVREGHVNRAKSVTTYLAGNGVNVARSLHLAGNAVSAVLPAGNNGTSTSDADDGLGLVMCRVEVEQPVRTNVILVDESGTTTNINALPAPLAPVQWTRLCEAATAEIERIGADWFVLGGALPINTATGQPVDIRPLLHAVRSLGVAICLDTPVGGAVAGWSKECQPNLVKPNAEELASLAGMSVRSLQDAVEAATLIRARGVETVLASLGPDGILEVSGRGTFWAHGPHAQVVNTTGAGDAALAGYLSVARRDSHVPGWPHDALRRAVSWGALAVQQATTILPHIITNPRGVQITSPERDRQLT